MIDFQPIRLEDREKYIPYLHSGKSRGCEYSFANLYLWGRQKAALINGQMVLFSQFNRKTVYPYPAGEGEKKPVLEAIIQDSQKRGIPCRITGLDSEDMEQMEKMFPGQFRYHCDRDSYDYVYAIDDLADLKGKKYQPKRNHINRFLSEYPNAVIRPLDESTLPDARNLADRWYQRRTAEEDAGMEMAALNRAFANWQALGLEGLVLYVGNQVVAMAIGSFLGEDTVDVHFEKADLDYNGAYAVINRAFARHIREKYPQVKFLNREEDMGLEGLRKAKLSYYPHHMVEKCWAHLMTEEFHDY